MYGFILFIISQILDSDMQYIHCDALSQLKSFLEKKGVVLPEYIPEENVMEEESNLQLQFGGVLWVDVQEFDSEPYPEIPEEKEVGNDFAISGNE